MWFPTFLRLIICFFLPLHFVITFAFDTVFVNHYGDFLIEAHPEETESQGEAPVVFAQNRQNPSDWASASEDLPGPEFTSFARLWFSTCHRESNAEPKCPMAMLALQTAPQAQCVVLPDLPNAVAVGYGPHVHPWRQAAATADTATVELSRSTALLPRRSVTTQPKISEKISKSKEEVSKRRQRKRHGRVWAAFAVPALSAVATSGLHAGPTIASTQWTTTTLDASWCPINIMPMVNMMPGLCRATRLRNHALPCRPSHPWPCLYRRCQL